LSFALDLVFVWYWLIVVTSVGYETPPTPMRARC
jgi:hypothetical protein